MKQPSQRVRSLWDMIDIDIHNLLTNTALLRSYIDIDSERNVSASAVTDWSRKNYLHLLREFYPQLNMIGANMAMRSLSRLVGVIEQRSEITNEQLTDLAKDFELRVRDEFEIVRVFVIEPNRRQFYEPEDPLFGKDVLERYPTAYYEIEEAGKCLALGRSTACVFHLMRVLEIGIATVAKALGIPDPSKPAEKNWGAVLKKIKGAIEEKSVAPQKSFFEEVHASLDSVRNPWRNATMHVENVYTEEGAENIYHAVRAFMMKIASQIDEEGTFVCS